MLACNPTKTLTEGQYLVNKNVIDIDNKSVSTDDISGYIKQKPNRRILWFFRFHLGVYNYATIGKKESKLDKWIINTIGEPPVILDTLLTKKSVKQIKLYLNSKGYFNSVVSKEIVYRKKRAKIKYIAKTSQPYTIRNVKYFIEDNVIESMVYGDSTNSLIIPGRNYDSDVLQSERERITNNLKNDGYFYFAKEFISYDVDSAFGTHQLDITMDIRNPLVRDKNNPDMFISMNHQRYTINDINIYPDFSSLDLDTSKYKTFLYLAAKRKKTSAPAPYIFKYKDTLKIRPRTITQSIFFEKGDYFKLKDVDLTYNSFMDLKVFKFANIKFTETPTDSLNKANTLDCKIQLTRTPVQSFSVETEATNSAGNLGVAGNFVYLNKNVFKGAEIFKFKIRGAMEIQKIFGDTSSGTGIQQILPFNTVETGADAGIIIPKFLLPVSQERFPKYFKPKTTINTGINYQKRPDYTRYILNVSYGYEWKESSKKKHILYPADVSSVKIYPTEKFQAKIDAINDPKIKNSYKDHLTMALKYSFIYNEQLVNKSKSFSYLRADFETSGFMLRNINSLFNSQLTEGSYELFNIKYSQYIRANADIRHYFVFDQFNTLVVHGAGGYGLAYKNSMVLPFEKSFYAGGANSLRAWRIYSLGPGSYHDTTGMNRTGDIDLETNVEYRFPIYSFLKGALFTDFGNIWLNRKNINMPGGEFKFYRFYKEFAVDFGFGARFDFSFFILRIDAALPARDPSHPENDRWVLKYSKFKDFRLNLGIGYPF